MNIELRPVADINPYEKNPRINDGAVEAVAKSIREFGFRQPIVVDVEGVIVVGHTRWKAAKMLGLEPGATLTLEYQLTALFPVRITVPSGHVYEYYDVEKEGFGVPEVLTIVRGT